MKNNILAEFTDKFVFYKNDTNEVCRVHFRDIELAHLIAIFVNTITADAENAFEKLNESYITLVDSNNNRYHVKASKLHYGNENHSVFYNYYIEMMFKHGELYDTFRQYYTYKQISTTNNAEVDCIRVEKYNDYLETLSHEVEIVTVPTVEDGNEDTINMSLDDIRDTLSDHSSWKTNASLCMDLQSYLHKRLNKQQMVLQQTITNYITVNDQRIGFVTEELKKLLPTDGMFKRNPVLITTDLCDHVARVVTLQNRVHKTNYSDIFITSKKLDAMYVELLSFIKNGKYWLEELQLGNNEHEDEFFKQRIHSFIVYLNKLQVSLEANRSQVKLSLLRINENIKTTDDLFNNILPSIVFTLQNNCGSIVHTELENVIKMVTG